MSWEMDCKHNDECNNCDFNRKLVEEKNKQIKKLEALILLTDPALSSEECGGAIQLKQWSEYRKHYSND